MLKSLCPACGALLTFQSAVSTFAVCGYCQSTVIRKDDALETSGKMAQVIEDSSPVQIGATGQYLGNGFTIIGRVQYEYEAGVWNEWHALFDSGKSGWLSELNGRSVFTYQQEPEAPLPAFSQLRPGLQLVLARQRFEVAYLAQARVVAGQGELPFAIGSGYEAPVADLRGVGHPGFATLDYSDVAAAQPRLYLGLDIAFADLKMQGLREERSTELAAGKTRLLDCPNCGASVPITRADTQAITCPSCHSTLGVEHAGVQLLQKYAAAEVIDPPLPLGQRGSLRGREFEVVGFLQRYVEEDGTHYFWDEYLLYEEKTGKYGWLVCGNQGWQYGEVLGVAPQADAGSTVKYEDKNYQLTESSLAVTDYVLGEFNWKVQRGDRATSREYRRGDATISCETTSNEITWTLLTKIPAKALSDAFKVQVPETQDHQAPAGLGEMFAPGGSGPGLPAGLAAGATASSLGCGGMILIFIIIIVIIIILSALDGGSDSGSYSRGTSGGYSSGGSHK